MLPCPGIIIQVERMEGCQAIYYIGLNFASLVSKLSGGFEEFTVI